jgi:hypothetical protein
VETDRNHNPRPADHSRENAVIPNSGPNRPKVVASVEVLVLVWRADFFMLLEFLNRFLFANLQNWSTGSTSFQYDALPPMVGGV